MRAQLMFVSLGLAVIIACGSDRNGFDQDPNLPAPGQVGGDCGATQCALGTTCVNGKCLPCVPGQMSCSGNEVHECGPDGQIGKLVETCDPSRGMACSDGKCATACEAAAAAQSNVGCEFWSVDLDLSDGVSLPGAGPWGLVLSNASQIPSNVRVEKNTAPVGQPVVLQNVYSGTIPVGQLVQVAMPQAITDCGTSSDDHASPGTCITSSAFRVTSTAPIVAYQFNNMVHNYSTDASLLLPTSVLGQLYRAIGWGSGSPFPAGPIYVQRAYVTIVGTQANTQVTVNPTWRIKGNGSVPATPAGGTINVTLGPFDVLNLESDDATIAECSGPAHVKAPFCTDLTGSIIQASAPVAVFSGTESSGVGPPDDAPKPPGNPEIGGCCKQHLEEQLPPLESIGKKFVLTRSPIRSTADDYVESDVIRFVGAAATSVVTTNLHAPFDHFTIAPGQILDTWSDKDAVITATEPIIIGQYLVAQDFVLPNPKGDPSFTIVPPVEQQRNEYVFLSPNGWTESWVVIGTLTTTKVKIDGTEPTNCIIAPAGTLDGKAYEARRCPLAQGVHSLSGDAGFGIMAYGFNDADAYSFPGGAFVKHIYVPPRSTEPIIDVRLRAVAGRLALAKVGAVGGRLLFQLVRSALGPAAYLSATWFRGLRATERGEYVCRRTRGAPNHLANGAHVVRADLGSTR